MTSSFDSLMFIAGIREKGNLFNAVATELATICVKEADRKRKDWNFKIWQNLQRGKTCLEIYGKDELIWHYLNDCHDRLDHTEKFHLKVFTKPIFFLIEKIAKFFSGIGLYKKDIEKIQKKIPSFKKFVKEHTKTDGFFVFVKEQPK